MAGKSGTYDLSMTWSGVGVYKVIYPNSKILTDSVVGVCKVIYPNSKILMV